MVKEIKSCEYFNQKEKVKYSIKYKNDKAEITKSNIEKKDMTEEKKLIKKEYLSNLDIFFERYDFENFNRGEDELNSSEGVKIEREGRFYTCFKNENRIFDDIKKYLEMCFCNAVNPVELRFHSFDGGGPEYAFKTEVKGIFTWYCERVYYKPEHEQLCGAGFDVIYYLYPLRVGEASAVITAHSPICEEPPQRIFVKTDEKLNITYRIEFE